jgi:hypothetical protein
VDRVALSLCFFGCIRSVNKAHQSSREQKSSQLRSLVIDKTLGEIGKEYWTEIVFETML